MKNVLVADDTKNIRILLTKCLELEGYEVTTASDGQQALEMLKNKMFDLAFIDIKMPLLSGTEVLRRIRELGINIPVIIITAYATVKNAIVCTQLGAVAYLQKPFTADKVRSTLAELLNVSIDCLKKCDNRTRVDKIEEAINQGLYPEAIELLKKAISDEPSNPVVHLLFGKVYEQMGDLDEAGKFYRMYKVLIGD